MNKHSKSTHCYLCTYNKESKVSQQMSQEEVVRMNKRITVQTFLKAVAGISLSVIFICWTTWSCIKYREEPTSTTITYSIGKENGNKTNT